MMARFRLGLILMVLGLCLLQVVQASAQAVATDSATAAPGDPGAALILTLTHSVGMLLAYLFGRSRKKS